MTNLQGPERGAEVIYKSCPPGSPSSAGSFLQVNFRKPSFQDSYHFREVLQPARGHVRKSFRLPLR